MNCMAQRKPTRKATGTAPPGPGGKRPSPFQIGNYPKSAEQLQRERYDDPADMRRQNVACALLQFDTQLEKDEVERLEAAILREGRRIERQWREGTDVSCDGMLGRVLLAIGPAGVARLLRQAMVEATSHLEPDVLEGDVWTSSGDEPRE
jgi:hypothetical protein